MAGGRRRWTTRVRRKHTVYRDTVTLCVHALNIMKIVVLLHTISGAMTSMSGRKTADQQAGACPSDRTVTAMKPCSDNATDNSPGRRGSCTGPVHRVGMSFAVRLFMRKVSAHIVVDAELIQTLTAPWQNQDTRCFRKCGASSQQQRDG